MTLASNFASYIQQITIEAALTGVLIPVFYLGIRRLFDSNKSPI